MKKRTEIQQDLKRGFGSIPIGIKILVKWLLVGFVAYVAVRFVCAFVGVPAATGVLSAGFRTRRILRAGFPFGIGPLAERVLLVRSLSFPVGRSVAGKVFRALSRSVAAVSRPFTAFGRSVRPEDFRLFQPSAIQSRLPCSVAVVSVHRPARM